MESIEVTIEKSYQAEIALLYKVLSGALSVAGDSVAEINGAKQRFKSGLEHSANVRNVARELAGL